MILTCPACSTKYVVKDGAIPQGGRQVRCASCKHSWHQDPETMADVASEPEEQSLADAAMIDPGSGPEAEQRAYEEAMIAEDDGSSVVSNEAGVAASAVETETSLEAVEPGDHDQWDQTVTGGEAAAALSPEPASEWVGGAPKAEAVEFEPFYEPEPVAAQRRGIPGLVWLLLIVVVIAVAGWFLAPEALRQRLGLAAVVGTPLEIMVTNSDRQKLASGNELFAVSGRVINPTDQSQRVPPLKAELLDSTRKRVVYSWTIAPPAAILAPGASASFNSAEVDVPQGGSHLRVTLEGPAA